MIMMQAYVVVILLILLLILVHMSLELFKINQSIFIPVSFVEHLNKHSKMSTKKYCYLVC